MAKEAWVVPRKGLVVRNPTSMAPLPESGGLVPLGGLQGTFWKRRIRCGDVTVVPAAKQSKPKGGSDK